MTQRFPIRWDLTGEDAITQGADWIRYIGIDLYDATTDTESTWDLTGYTARLAIRPDYGEDAVLTGSTTDGRISTALVTDDDGNEYSLTITFVNAVTAALADWGRGVWDLEVEDSFGHVTRLYHGYAVLSREVSI